LEIKADDQKGKYRIFEAPMEDKKIKFNRLGQPLKPGSPLNSKSWSGLEIKTDDKKEKYRNI